MIHLTLHKTSAEYEAVKENLESPQVSFIKETNVVVFKKGTSSLYLSAYSLSFDSSGQTNSIAVTSTDGQWTATTASDWLTISPLNGNEGETSVSITASENGTDEARTAQISFSNGTTTRSLNISQETSQVTPYSERYLTLDILTGGTVMWKTNHSASTKTISYSINDGEWTEITSTTAGTTFNVSAGDKVRLKGSNGRYTDNAYQSSSIADGTAYFNIEGNIMSLIGGDNFTGLTELTLGSTFRNIFKQSNVVSAENLVLPPTNVSNWSYAGMFYGCTSLTVAPELPATIISTGSYYDMFNGCTSLTVAPEIHAANVAGESCRGMFYGCTSLTAVTQALPATTLAGRCYYDMFNGCASLTAAPVICATTVASGSCCCMFCNCSSLTTAPALPSTALAEDCYYRMFDGCTSLATAPLLPATTIYTQSYRAMFSNCSSLTVAPVICATTLATSACTLMFNSCTSLTVAPELPAMTLANDCYNQMFARCTSLTTAPELPATTLAEKCYFQMFIACTGLTTTPSELPATTLANNCYNQMFNACSGITASPVLPAPSLVVGCYSQMFKDCGHLKYVKCLATDISATDAGGKKCTWEWFYHTPNNSGCTFIKDSTMNDWTRDTDGIPSNWTVYDDTHIVVTGVSLNAQTATTNVGDTYALTATVSPSNASNKNITWSTSDSSVATVTNGIVSGVSCGNAVITVVTEEIGYSAQCEVTVENPVTGVSLNVNSIYISSGGTYQLSATVNPIGACNTAVTWASDNTSVATVNSNGIISGITTGSATITVTTVEGGYSAQCSVSVVELLYTELEYIESTASGGQYIDLNIKLYETLNNWYDIAIKYNVSGAGKGNNQPTLFGCQNQTNPWPGTFIRMAQATDAYTQGRYIGGSYKDNRLGDNGTVIELQVQTAPSKNVYNLNNSNRTHSFGTSLFCVFTDTNNTPSKFIAAKLYYFKLFLKDSENSQGVLVRDMVPCKRLSDNAIGLLDNVNNVFYTSPSGDAFVAGPEVNA